MTVEFINMYEFIAILVIISHANFQQKIHLMFLVFDFDVSEYINVEELICIVGNSIVGYCKVSGQTPPSY